MAGYSSNPLFKKLGLKEGLNVKIINPPPNYHALIGEISTKINIRKVATEEVDFIHFFTNNLLELENQLPTLKNQIKKNGMIWVSWFKKSSGKSTEITEDIIRDTALAIGLVDVKVCAVDDSWSGLKLVYRLSERGNS